MFWEQQIQYASISDIGFRRQMNQDSFGVQICPARETWEQFGHLFVVCDGMGGHAVGELASKIAIDTIPHVFFKSRDQSVESALQNAIELANTSINDRGTQNHDFQRMGTTCSALCLSPAGAIIGHVGDSRVYRIRQGRIDQLTFDHSLQWELIKQGRLTPEEIFLKEPRNVITRSLGPLPTVQVDVEGPHPVLPGDTYLLCSDGLTGHVNDAEIGMITRHLSPAEATRTLVHLANLRGGSDNVTVVIARVGEIPSGLALSPTLAEDAAAEVEESGLSWGWLGALWAIAGLYVLSVCLLMLRDWINSALAFSTAVTATGACVWFLFRQRQRRRQLSALGVTGPPRATGPYRSASTQLIPQFVSHLAAVEAELQRTGHDEAWDIDWPRHQTASQNAQSFLAHNRLEEALAELAQAIDVLMSGVQLHRKQRQHQARWGKPPRIVPRAADEA